MPYNSIIRVRQKICVNCGKPCYWFSKKRCKDCARVEDFHAKEEKIVEEEGLQDLVSDLDTLVSRWVRYSAVGENNLVQCYTCSLKFPPIEMDAGHYITRGCMYLRFDSARNIRPQCQICNRYKYGKAAQFGQNLELEFPGITDILLEESRIVYKWTRDELRTLIAEYTQKTKLL